MKLQGKVLTLLVFLIAAPAFGQSNATNIPVVFHTTEHRWDWAETPVKDIFSPYTIESVQITKSYVRSENERQVIVKALLGLIRSDNKFAGGLSLSTLGEGLEAVVLTKEGKIFIIRRVSSGIYKITSEEKSGYVIYIGDDKKKS